MTEKQALEIIKNAVIERQTIMEKQFNEIYSKYKKRGNEYFEEKGRHLADQEIRLKYGDVITVEANLWEARFFLEQNIFAPENDWYALWYALNRDATFNKLNEKEKLYIYDLCNI